MILNITNQNMVLTISGNQGPAGSNVSTYAVRFDQVDAATIYRAEASPGSLDSAASWRIQKVIISGNDVQITWASGNASFDKIWNNRLSYTYS